MIRKRTLNCDSNISNDLKLSICFFSTYNPLCLSQNCLEEKRCLFGREENCIKPIIYNTPLLS